MARKKVVFIIVEGPSDQEALETLLAKIFDSSAVIVKVMYGDITTDFDVTPINIKKKLAEAIKSYANQFSLKSPDFWQVIHLIDTDGTYAPDDCILENESLDKPIYSTTTITAKKRMNIVDRNQRKRKNTNVLYTCSEIWSIPYSAYYMSCNLDHVLHNKLNSTDEEKEADAHAFAKAYRDNVEAFVKFICESDFSVTGEYLNTWQFIKEEKHSLERYTNFGICLKKDKCDEDSYTPEETA